MTRRDLKSRPVAFARMKTIAAIGTNGMAAWLVWTERIYLEGRMHNWIAWGKHYHMRERAEYYIVDFTTFVLLINFVMQVYIATYTAIYFTMNVFRFSVLNI